MKNNKNSNIKIIRLKKLLCGMKEDAKTKWIKEYELQESKIDILLNKVFKFKETHNGKQYMENEITIKNIARL